MFNDNGLLAKAVCHTRSKTFTTQRDRIVGDRSKRGYIPLISKDPSFRESFDASIGIGPLVS